MSENNVNNSNLLKIDYNPQKGLILKWNLKGCLSQQFLRHILIFDTDSKFEECAQFAQLYLQKLKPGDFLAIAYMNEENCLEMSAWKERGPNNKVRVLESYLGDLSRLDIKFILREIYRQIEMFDQICVVSYFSPEKDITDLAKEGQSLNQWYSNVVYAQNSQQTIILNLFGKFQNVISLTHQINTFNIVDSSQEDILNFLKSHLCQIALSNLNLSIQCKNGNLCSQKFSAWKNSEFNKIERKMKAVTSDYEQDLLFFLNQDSYNETKYELKITLQFENLEKRRFKASKSVTIETINEKVYYRTIGANSESQGFFLIARGVETRQNPFRSDNFIWFTKNNQSDNGIQMKV